MWNFENVHRYDNSCNTPVSRSGPKYSFYISGSLGYVVLTTYKSIVYFQDCQCCQWPISVLGSSFLFFRSFSLIALTIHVVPTRVSVSQHGFPQAQESVGNIPFVSGILVWSLCSTSSLGTFYMRSLWRISNPSWRWGLVLSFRPYIILSYPTNTIPSQTTSKLGIIWLIIILA